MSDVASKTEIKFDLSALTAADFPRVKGTSSAGALAVLPRVVSQCPYGPADQLATWAKLPWRTLAGVMRQLNAEAKTVRDDLKGWTFDMETLTPEDMDFIEAAVFKQQFKDGARMIAKYTSGVPVAVMKKVQAARAVMSAGEAAELREEDGAATGGDSGALTAADVLAFPYYSLFAPLISRLREEARAEFQAGFLNALSETSAFTG